MDHRFSGFLRRLSIILFWIVLWQTAASLIRNHIFLVGPVDTLRALCEQIVLPDFWSAIAFSFWRISIGFFLAFFLGLFTGSLAYRFPIVDEFLEPLRLYLVPRGLSHDPCEHESRADICGPGAFRDGGSLPHPVYPPGALYLPHSTLPVLKKRLPHRSRHGI